MQVGCGPKNLFPDWWNMDIRSFRGIDEVADVTKPWPWKNTLDYVFGEHFLEHLDILDAMAFLVEAGNALRPGGKIRLTTPSLEWVMKTHFTFDQSGMNSRVAQTFNINRAFHGWGHRFLYSREFLIQAVTSVGLEDPRIFNYGESDDPHLRGIERHGGWRVDEGYPSVWIIEATRGATECARESEFVSRLQNDFVRYVAAGH